MDTSVNAETTNESSPIISEESENDENITEKSSCARLQDIYYNCLAVKIVRFIICVVLNIVSVACDWLLYRNVAGAEEGLVFGPSGNDVKNALKVSSILCSITFVFKVILDLLEIMCKQEHDLLRACLLLPDIFLMMTNISIAICREAPNSYFQMGKSILIIIGFLIPIMLSTKKFYILRIKERKKWEEVDSLLLKIIAVYLQLSFAFLVFVYTQLEMNEDGIIQTKVPHTYFKGVYDDRKYLTNVSIYFSHPYLDYETNHSSDRLNFIRLLSIYDVQNSEIDRTVNIKYDITHENFLIQTDGKLKQCFTKMNGTVIMQAVCSDQLLSPAGQFAFTFHYVEPSIPKLIFGDITYNMRAGNNTDCEAPDFQVVNNIDAYNANSSSAMMRYYRTNPNITEEYHIIQTSNDTYEFYRESDLINIEDVWVRKWGPKNPRLCKSTGSRSPNTDERLEVQCL